MTLQPILPIFGSGQRFNTGLTSASVSLGTVSDKAQVLIITNPVDVTQFCKWGIGTVTASSADYAIPAYTQVVVRIGFDGALTFAAQCPTGVYIDVSLGAITG